MPRPTDIGQAFEIRVADLLDWELKDRSPHGRVSDVYSKKDEFCGECKATAKASRGLKTDEILKIEKEANGAGMFSWVYFTQMKARDGRIIETATVDLEVFADLLDCARTCRE